jgi:hypothetical protein
LFRGGRRGCDTKLLRGRQHRRRRWRFSGFLRREAAHRRGLHSSNWLLALRRRLGTCAVGLQNWDGSSEAVARKCDGTWLSIVDRRTADAATDRASARAGACRMNGEQAPGGNYGHDYADGRCAHGRTPSGIGPGLADAARDQASGNGRARRRVVHRSGAEHSKRLAPKKGQHHKRGVLHNLQPGLVVLTNRAAAILAQRPITAGHRAAVAESL